MKKMLGFVIAICIGFGLYMCLKPEESASNNVLSTVLTDDEIKNIEDKGQTSIASQFIKEQGFNKNNLDRYIQFYESNKDVKVADIIKIVNNDIDKIDKFIYNSIIIDLLDEEYYIYDNTIRYINYYEKNDSLTAKEIVTNVNSNIDYEFYTNTKKTDMSKGNLILVNKYNYLDKYYEPEDLVEILPGYTTNGGYLTEDAWKAFKEMAHEAYQEKIDLYAISPYRSYNTQESLYERYAAKDGYEQADTYSARPGFSEHQTGLAVDINSADDSFADTKEAKWLNENAYKYGFILRYPKGKEYITGYQYEPWHFRYVGLETAKYIYEHDITFEEYYAYFVEKKD